MITPEGEIQDILTDICDDDFYDYVYDYHETTVIENNDIEYLNDVEALWAAIVGVLKTEVGVVDGVGLENYGSRLLSLMGEHTSWFNAELAKVYIKETIPQFQGYVLDFPVIDIYEPVPETSDRRTMIIKLTVDSVFGRFTRTFYM
jgi:hypothetical protein